MPNYTPLNISAILRHNISKNNVSNIKNRKGFDGLFFPLSIVILLASLSFYGVRLVLDTAVNPADAVKLNSQPSDIMRAVVRRKPTLTPSAPAVSEQMYTKIGDVELDPQSLLKSAEDFYPDAPSIEIIKGVKNEVLRWATLRNYYRQNPSIRNGLTIDTFDKVATFGAVLKDLDYLRRRFFATASNDEKLLNEIVKEFVKNNQIKTEQ
jgi:hypothetical protein